MQIDQSEHDVLTQALTGGTGIACRNYFCAQEGHHAWAQVQSLVMKGLMYVGQQVPGQPYRYFHATYQGAQAVGLPLPADRRTLPTAP